MEELFYFTRQRLTLAEVADLADAAGDFCWYEIVDAGEMRLNVRLNGSPTGHCVWQRMATEIPSLPGLIRFHVTCPAWLLTSLCTLLHSVLTRYGGSVARSDEGAETFDAGSVQHLLSAPVQHRFAGLIW